MEWRRSCEKYLVCVVRMERRNAVQSTTCYASLSRLPNRKRYIPFCWRSIDCEYSVRWFICFQKAVSADFLIFCHARRKVMLFTHFSVSIAADRSNISFLVPTSSCSVGSYLMIFSSDNRHRYLKRQSRIREQAKTILVKEKGAFATARFVVFCNHENVEERVGHAG